MSPRRIAATIGLAVALVATPWVIGAVGDWSWLWLAGVALFAVVYFALLLMSYLRLKSARRAEEMSVAVSALTETQGLREVRLRDSLSHQIGDLEARITRLIDARLEDVRHEGSDQLRSVTALSADRLEVLRDNLERRVETLSRTTGQIGTAVQDLAARTDATAARLSATDQGVRSELGEVRGDLMQVQEDVARQVGQTENFAAEIEAILEARVSAVQSRQDQARRELEQMLAVRLDALDAQPAQVVSQLEARIAAERTIVQDAFFGLRTEVERLLDERGQKTGESFAYLRALLDRRVQAGASVLQGQMEQLKQDLQSRLWDLEEARRAQPTEELAAEMVSLRTRIAEIGDLRVQVSEALEREASNRSTAIEAVVTAVAGRHAELESQIQAAHPIVAARLDEFQTLMDARMGPEFETRLEAWRARLDNEIGDALQKGRTEDEIANHEREARLRGELQSLHDAILRGREETAGHHEAVVRSIATIRRELDAKADVGESAAEAAQGAVEVLRSETAIRLDEQAEKHGEAVRRLVEVIDEARTDSARLTETLEQQISERLAKVASDAVDALRRETAQRLDLQDEKHDQVVSRIVKVVEETRSEATQQAEALERRLSERLQAQDSDRETAVARSVLDIEAAEVRITERLAEGVLARVDTFRSEIQAGRAAILEHADHVARERASEALAQARDLLASKEEVAVALETARQATGEVASRADLEAVRAAAEEALATAAKAAHQAAQQSEAGQAAGAEQIARLEQGIKKVEARANASANAMRRLSDSNAVAARPFERLLSDDKAERIKQHWLKAFGINMSGTALAYMAHKICLLEDRGLGRIAAPIETIVMRQLALRSLPNRGRLEVLEIGSLFGLSAAVLYNFQGARSSGMYLTLLDPLEGYYEAGGADPVTGIEVNEAVLRKNLAELDVPKSDYRLIKELSADATAIKAASDRLYDFVLVDGDHSTAGVAADFENYGPLVKPGGLIIFDDYGSEHWPGIQPYVDEVVRTDPNWIWIGADYRTAVLAKKADGAIARITPPRASRPTKPAPSRPASSTRRKKS